MPVDDSSYDRLSNLIEGEGTVEKNPYSSPTYHSFPGFASHRRGKIPEASLRGPSLWPLEKNLSGGID